MSPELTEQSDKPTVPPPPDALVEPFRVTMDRIHALLRGELDNLGAE